MKILHTVIATFFIVVAPLLALAQNESSQGLPPVKFITGGVGAESMAQINAEEANYNFKLMMVRSKSGEYLSKVNVVITDAAGNTQLQTITEGPVLLAQLEPGRYIVTATDVHKHSITKNLDIKKSKTEETFRFPEPEGN